MNILQVTPAFRPAYVYGGPIESIYQQCSHLAMNGCEVIVLTTNSNGKGKTLDVINEEEIQIQKRLRVIYCNKVMLHSVSPSLLRLLKKYILWSDLEHLRAVYSFPTIPTLLLCRLFNKPVVWSPHGSLQRWAGSRRPHLKLVWESICRAVAPRKLILHTTCDQEAKESNDRFPKAEVATVPHGIAIPAHVRRETRSPLFRLLYIGLLNPKKGVENLLEACSILQSEGRMRWSLTIAGAGETCYTNSIRTKIRNMGLTLQEGIPGESLNSIHTEASGQVCMVGHVIGDEKERLFHNADILVVPSYTENFAIVIAEALSRGVPVIASRGTPWARLEEMGCGLWIHNDPKSLAAAIEHMKHSPLLEMGKNGREWMMKEFNWEFRTQQIITCYRRIVS
jgi:glycosyltransferase involved in cell wall biosynthesis